MVETLQKFLKYLGKEDRIKVKHRKDGSYSIILKKTKIECFFNKKGRILREVTPNYEYFYNSNGDIVDVIHASDRIFKK